jgi:multidrug efflux pump subunit AcrB
MLLPRLIRNIPPGIEVKVVQDRTRTIRASVQDVEFTLAVTVVLVVMVILLFLRNFWATLIPGITVPLALLGSAAAMYLLGFSLDNLSLMALTIAVGFVVDDAIVVVENIHRHVENGEVPFEAALTGAREIGFTVLSISFSLIAVFIPLLLMGGIIGRLFREFALTVTASIAVSEFVSLTLAPMLCARFMRPESHSHGRIYRFIEAGFDAMLSFYRSTLDVVLRHQPITLCVFFATMALTAAMMYYTPKGFFPIQDIDLISGIAEASQDVSPQKMISLETEVDRIILGDPAVDGVVTSFGPSFGNTGNIERLNVILKPREERDVDSSQVIDRLRPQLAKIVGVTTYLQPAQDSRSSRSRLIAIRLGGSESPLRQSTTRSTTPLVNARLPSISPSSIPTLLSSKSCPTWLPTSIRSITSMSNRRLPEPLCRYPRWWSSTPTVSVRCRSITKGNSPQPHSLST